jgi:hypothetical protein
MPENNKPDDPLSTAADTIATGFACIAESVANALATVVEGTAVAVVNLAHGIADILWEGYRNAGMPYGDSHAGLMCWIDDMHKISQARAEIERIEQHHQMLIHARQPGEQIRAKHQQEQEEETDPHVIVSSPNEPFEDYWQRVKSAVASAQKEEDGQEPC